MSNLLPPANKKKVKLEYFSRFLGVFLILSALTFLLLSIFSLPPYFLSRGKASVAAERVEFLKSYIDQGQDSDRASVLLGTNEKIEVLNLASDLKLSRSIQSVLDKKSSSIKITNFSLQTSGEEKKNLSITGIALNRDSLLSFSESLGSVKEFESVDLPVSNLAKNEDISFNLNIGLRLNSSQ